MTERIKNKDNIGKIFHTLYKIETQNIQLVDPNEHKLTGRVVSGFSDYDDEWAKLKTTVSLPISVIAEFVYDDAYVNLIDPKDSVNMYLSIYDHLKSWLDYTSGTLNHERVPMDDFNKLAKLADILYPTAFYCGLYNDKNYKINGWDEYKEKSILNVNELFKDNINGMSNEEKEQLLNNPPHKDIFNEIKYMENRIDNKIIRTMLCRN